MEDDFELQEFLQHLQSLGVNSKLLDVLLNSEKVWTQTHRLNLSELTRAMNCSGQELRKLLDILYQKGGLALGITTSDQWTAKKKR